MNKMEKYRQYFTKDFLMGPNSFRLLEELLRRCPFDACWNRTLDLGCGMALTSVFLANETPAKSVYAFDLWVDATDNLRRITDLGLEEKIIPIRGDAMDMPFAKGYFDTVVSVDSYHYFGCHEGVFAGLREEPRGELLELFRTWAEGDDALCFHTFSWWKALLEKECGNRCTVSVLEAECGCAAWEDWFSTGHKYGIRDREFLSRGLDRILNFPLICVRKES